MTILTLLNGNKAEEEGMKLLTTREVADFISQKTGKRMSARQVIREINGGYIKAERIGTIGKGQKGYFLVKESSLKNYKRRHPGKRGKNE